MKFRHRTRNRVKIKQQLYQVYFVAVFIPIFILGVFLLSNTYRLLGNYHRDLLKSDNLRVKTILFEITTQIYNLMDSVIAIGAGAKDPQRMADFIDWLYSPEGVMSNEAGGMSGAAGPEGICWEYGGNGPVLTEFGKRALYEASVEVPEEYGGGIWNEGLSQLNFKPVDISETDEKGYPYQFQLWESVQDMQVTKLDHEWREYMGADTTMEYLVKNDKIIVFPVGSYVIKTENAEQAAIRKQCKKVIQQYSWNMVFSADEQQFLAFLKEMQDKLKGLRYEEILAFDIENAEAVEMQKKLLLAKYQ